MIVDDFKAECELSIQKHLLKLNGDTDGTADGLPEWIDVYAKELQEINNELLDRANELCLSEESETVQKEIENVYESAIGRFMDLANS